MVPFIVKLQDKQQRRNEAPFEQIPPEQLSIASQKAKLDKTEISTISKSKSAKTKFSESPAKPMRKSTKIKPNLSLQKKIPDKSRILVISAAPRRIPRRLQPIHSAASDNFVDERISPASKLSDLQWTDTLPNLPGATSPKKVRLKFLFYLNRIKIFAVFY